MKVALLALAAVVAGCGGSGPQSSDRVAPTSVATVTTRTLSETTPVSGKLGYAGGYTVLGGLSGSITALPAVGQVIRNGQTLYRVDDAPVVLLYGSTPAYRALAEGATGTDVAQLNHDLVALGYASRADLDPAWDEFNWATRVGVEQLQDHLGRATRPACSRLGRIGVPADRRARDRRCGPPRRPGGRAGAERDLDRA